MRYWSSTINCVHHSLFCSTVEPQVLIQVVSHSRTTKEVRWKCVSCTSVVLDWTYTGEKSGHRAADHITLSSGCYNSLPAHWLQQMQWRFNTELFMFYNMWMTSNTTTTTVQYSFSLSRTPHITWWWMRLYSRFDKAAEQTLGWKEAGNKH